MKHNVASHKIRGGQKGMTLVELVI
ncbi:MAG: hypothetical protein RIQ72_30, partial [Candidatus Parcubacteria bacterium]